MGKKILLLVCAIFLIAACSSDNADSDNENIPDDLTPTDHAGTVDDAIAAIDDTVTVDDAPLPTDEDTTNADEDTVILTDEDEPPTDDIATDDIATDDIVTDGIVTDEETPVPDNDTVEIPDEEEVLAAIACCVEIVKEWFRCDGLKTDQADACTACVAGLASCTDFEPKETDWPCAASCNDICEPGTVVENSDTVGQGTGKTRRAVAEEYCTWMVDYQCAYEPADFTGLGSTEPLEACF